MRAAYDEVVRGGARPAFQRIFGELLLAQLADQRASSLRNPRSRGFTPRGGACLSGSIFRRVTVNFGSRMHCAKPAHAKRTSTGHSSLKSKQLG
jgi:hypothetical protein